MTNYAAWDGTYSLVCMHEASAMTKTNIRYDQHFIILFRWKLCHQTRVGSTNVLYASLTGHCTLESLYVSELTM